MEPQHSSSTCALKKNPDLNCSVLCQLTIWVLSYSAENEALCSPFTLTGNLKIAITFIASGISRHRISPHMGLFLGGLPHAVAAISPGRLPSSCVAWGGDCHLVPPTSVRTGPSIPGWPRLQGHSEARTWGLCPSCPWHI